MVAAAPLGGVVAVHGDRRCCQMSTTHPATYFRYFTFVEMIFPLNANGALSK